MSKILKSLLLAVAAALVPPPVAAQVSVLTTVRVADSSPLITNQVPQADATAGARLNVAGLCTMVANQVPETDATTGTRFNYQTRLFRVAGVDAGRDSAEEIRDRMRSWWSAHQSYLHCNLLNSTVSGNILKLAIDRSANEFINDVVRRWGVDLNYRERRDGTTALDFIESEMSRASGTPREAIMRRYHRLFTDHGAKRGAELPDRAWGS